MTKKFLFTIAALLLSIPTMAQSSTDSTKVFDWEPVMEAIIWHESKGNPKIVCGPYVGVLQISPIMVKECNNILRQRGRSERFTLNDRYSIEKSKEIFKLIMSKYNPENNIDKACRIWAGGIHYSVKKTQPFVNWVHRYMEEHKK